MNERTEQRLLTLATLGATAFTVGASALALLVSGCSGGGSGASGSANTLLTFATPTRSSTIALTHDGRKAVVVNRESDSLAILRVRTATADGFEKLAEISVGQEPRSVCLTPDDRRAFVSNAVSGTVSVVSIDTKNVIKTIPVGTEPRGVAITPNGRRIFVANHTAGSLTVIDASTLSVFATLPVGRNPTALAITNDGDLDDFDETVFVTDFFSEAIPGGPGESFDDGKQGVVWALASNGSGTPTKVTLAPLSPASVGFGADRSPFCAAFNANVHSQIFCPDTNIVTPGDPAIVNDPQGAFPNQLQALVLRQNLLYVPNIGASPEPPVKFNVNVQALVNVVDTSVLAERADLAVNLNAQIKLEASPSNPIGTLQRSFGNDLVAIDATAAGDRFLIVSRGSNCVLSATLGATGALSINAPSSVVRFQTGNIPSGVVISPDGTRAYANNDVNLSITAIDLVNNVVIQRDVPTGTPPTPGSFDHAVLVGKLAFTTALGLPDFGVFTTPIRDFDPTQNRNQASDNAWSSCASCHPDGLTDNVSWIFGTGPRSTLPLDAFFSKSSPLDQRISNWSGIMGSVTDFNNNARGVQGGKGFAGDPPPTTIFNHGITEGASSSLDAMTTWVQTVRTLNRPLPSNPVAFGNGANVFLASCASCHGGNKWSKSQVIYDNDPTFNKDPNAGGIAFDPGLTNAGAQIVSFSETNPTTQVQLTQTFLDPVGTFNVANPLEIRGQGATAGITALGALGFNTPSLLGGSYTAPFLHDGSAPTLDDVFTRHALGAGTIQSTLLPQDIQDLKVFLDALDARTLPVESSTDDFLRTIRG